MPEVDVSSIAAVIGTAVRDAQTLIRTEIALAKAELRAELKRAGTAAAALTAAAVAALLGLTLLLVAVALGLAALLGWPAWSGFAIVAILVLATAGLLAAFGRRRLNGERHMPLTVDTLKENVQWLQAQTPRS